MDVSFILPNKKEVFVKEILYKDLRKISLYRDSTTVGVIEFLESFILTKGLNVAEKLLTFFILREKCIGENIAVGSSKGNVNIDLNLLRKNVGTFDDIKETVDIDEMRCVLNYPSRFNLGSTDFVFSLIESIELDDDKIYIPTLTDDEYNEVISKLPESVFEHLEYFVGKNKSHFNVSVFEGRENLEIDEIKLNMLDKTLPAFIARLFDCIDDQNYREMLFILCKRIPDITFLTNCTYLEIEDYYKMYSDELEKQSESLQKQEIS